MSTTLSWGLLATGSIAHTFARDLPRSRTGKLVAVGSRAEKSAQKFGREYGLADDACHGTYAALLADPRVEAVYISTPHPQHADWAVRAAESGKHILCEKPLTLNHAEAVTVVAAARANGVLLMEAFMYLCHPQMARVVEIIRAGTLGPVRLIEASFGFRSGMDPASRLLNAELGGGGILDVGCYAMSGARLIAGAALGGDYADPLEVHGAGRLSGQGTDEHAAATLRFAGGIVAQISCGVAVNLPRVLRVFGETGSLEVLEPWFLDCSKPARLRLRLGEREEEVAVPVDGRPLYALEADVFADTLARREREVPAPAMTTADSLGNMAALDRWRAAVGVVYPSERRVM